MEGKRYYKSTTVEWVQIDGKLGYTSVAKYFFGYKTNVNKQVVTFNREGRIGVLLTWIDVKSKINKICNIDRTRTAICSKIECIQLS